MAPPVTGRPLFDPHEISNPAREAGTPFQSLDGRCWTRVVFGDDGVCAAEADDGVLHVWDRAALFDAVFREPQ